MSDRRTEFRNHPPVAGKPSELIENRKIISFEDLAGGQRIVILELHGQRYRLRLTKSGRLVLTK